MSNFVAEFSHNLPIAFGIYQKADAVVGPGEGAAVDHLGVGRWISALISQGTKASDSPWNQDEMGTFACFTARTGSAFPQIKAAVDLGPGPAERLPQKRRNPHLYGPRKNDLRGLE